MSSEKQNVKVSINTLQASLDIIISNTGMTSNQAKSHIACWLMTNMDTLEMIDSHKDIANFLADRVLQ